MDSVDPFSRPRPITPRVASDASGLLLEASMAINEVGELLKPQGTQKPSPISTSPMYQGSPSLFELAAGTFDDAVGEGRQYGNVGSGAQMTLDISSRKHLSEPLFQRGLNDDGLNRVLEDVAFIDAEDNLRYKDESEAMTAARLLDMADQRAFASLKPETMSEVQLASSSFVLDRGAMSPLEYEALSSFEGPAPSELHTYAVSEEKARKSPKTFELDTEKMADSRMAMLLMNSERESLEQDKEADFFTAYPSPSSRQRMEQRTFDGDLMLHHRQPQQQLIPPSTLASNATKKLFQSPPSPRSISHSVHNNRGFDTSIHFTEQNTLSNSRNTEHFSHEQRVQGRPFSPHLPQPRRPSFTRGPHPRHHATAEPPAAAAAAAAAAGAGRRTRSGGVSASPPFSPSGGLPFRYAFNGKKTEETLRQRILRHTFLDYSCLLDDTADEFVGDLNGGGGEHKEAFMPAQHGPSNNEIINNAHITKFKTKEMRVHTGSNALAGHSVDGCVISRKDNRETGEDRLDDDTNGDDAAGSYFYSGSIGNVQTILFLPDEAGKSTKLVTAPRPLPPSALTATPASISGHNFAYGGGGDASSSTSSNSNDNDIGNSLFSPTLTGGEEADVMGTVRALANKVRKLEAELKQVVCLSDDVSSASSAVAGRGGRSGNVSGTATTEEGPAANQLLMTPAGPGFAPPLPPDIQPAGFCSFASQLLREGAKPPRASDFAFDEGTLRGNNSRHNRNKQSFNATTATAPVQQMGDTHSSLADYGYSGDSEIGGYGSLSIFVNEGASSSSSSSSNDFSPKLLSPGSIAAQLTAVRHRQRRQGKEATRRLRGALERQASVGSPVLERAANNAAAAGGAATTITPKGGGEGAGTAVFEKGAATAGKSTTTAGNEATMPTKATLLNVLLTPQGLGLIPKSTPIPSRSLATLRKTTKASTATRSESQESSAASTSGKGASSRSQQTPSLPAKLRSKFSLSTPQTAQFQQIFGSSSSEPSNEDKSASGVKVKCGSSSGFGKVSSPHTLGVMDQVDLVPPGQWATTLRGSMSSSGDRISNLFEGDVLRTRSSERGRRPRREKSRGGGNEFTDPLDSSSRSQSRGRSEGRRGGEEGGVSRSLGRRANRSRSGSPHWINNKPISAWQSTTTHNSLASRVTIKGVPWVP